MEKPTRMADIAKELNISTVTVSKALAGKSGVSEKLREKILNAAEEMGYQKNGMPIGSVHHKSYTIGVLAAERFLKENQSFSWKLYQEISQAFLFKNCFTILETVKPYAERACLVPSIIEQRKVKGVMVLGGFSGEYEKKLCDVLPPATVYLDTVSDHGYAVASDNLDGGYRMTNYLFEMGHKEIGFVGTRLVSPHIDDRFFGYLKSLMEHGAPCRAEWVLEDRKRELETIEFVQALSLPSPMPTAFFCSSDLTASVLMQTLEKNGYRVPEDISVAGFENDKRLNTAGMDLTTYQVNAREMARRAVQLIMAKFEKQSYPDGSLILHGKLIERGSVRRVGEAIPFL